MNSYAVRVSKIIDGKVLTKLILVLIIVLISGKPCADILHLKTGGTIDGRIIEETDTYVRIKTDPEIEFTVEKNKIESVEKKETEEDIYLQKVKEIKEGDAKGHYELGIYCKGRGLYEYAKKEFLESLNFDPNNAIVYNQLGLLYLQTKDIHNAVLSFQSALNLGPNNEEIQANLQSVLQTYPSEDYLIRKTNVTDSDAEGHYQLGIFCLSKGLNDAAKYEFNKVLSIDKAYKEKVEGQLGVLYENEAAKAYNKALILMNTRSYKEANQGFKDVIKIYPNSKIVAWAEKQNSQCEKLIKEEEERKKREADKKKAEQEGMLYALMKDAERLESKISDLQSSIQYYKQRITDRGVNLKIRHVKDDIENKKRSLSQMEIELQSLKKQMEKESITSVEQKIYGGRESETGNETYELEENVRCSFCRGTGWYYTDVYNNMPGSSGYTRIQKTCEVCNGTGWIER